jgi:hypothetical protein
MPGETTRFLSEKLNPLHSLDKTRQKMMLYLVGNNEKTAQLSTTCSVSISSLGMLMADSR